MGFGIALFGYAFLLLNEVGGAFIGALLLAYGLFLASRLDAGFLRASVTSLFMIPRGIFQLLTAFGILNSEELATVNIITFVLYVSAWAVMSFYWLSAVAKIANGCNAKKLESQARNRLVFTVASLFFVLSASVLNLISALGSFAYMFFALQYILQYAVIIVNIIFMHTCFVLITSEKQYQKDKQQIAIERAKAIEKSYKERREVEEKIEKRKK